MDILLENDDLNYTMQPTYIGNIPIYPIKYFLYKTYYNVISETILLPIDKLNNRFRQNFERLQREGEIPRSEKFKKVNQETLFDFIVSNCNEYYKDIAFLDKILNSTDSKKREVLLKDPKIVEKFIQLQNGTLDVFLKNMIKVIELSVNQQDYFDYLKNKDISIVNKVTFDGSKFIISNDDGVIGNIDSSNFELFREVVLYNNLINEPLVAYNLNSQKVIDKSIEIFNKDKKKTSIASVFSTVLSKFNYTDVQLLNMTYFRIMYDFGIAIREQNNLMSAMFKCVGANEVKIENMAEAITLHTNPYEDLFVKGNSKLAEAMNR